MKKPKVVMVFTGANMTESQEKAVKRVRRLLNKHKSFESAVALTIGLGTLAATTSPKNQSILCRMAIMALAEGISSTDHEDEDKDELSVAVRQ